VAGERDERGFGDLRFGDPPLLGLVEDRVRILDRGPRVVGNCRDRPGDRSVHSHGHAEPCLRGDRRGDDVAPVVARVRADHRLSAHPRSPGRGDSVADEPCRAVSADRVALAQPERSDHRRTRRRRQHRELGVEALDLGVAVGEALLGVAVGLADGVVDVHVGHPVRVARPGQQPRRHAGQPGQGPGGNRVELAHVPEPERAQERAQRRRRPPPVEDLDHSAVPQHVQIVDGVRAGEHPRDHARRLGRGVGRGHAQPLLQQVVQPGPFGQPHHRHQTRRPDQVRVIENRGHLVECLHLSDAPSEPV